MPNFRDRVCIVCNKITYHTGSKSEVCSDCYHKEKWKEKRAEENLFLASLGYTEIEEAPKSAHGKTCWTFIHPACGTKQTWVFANLQKCCISIPPGIIPCSSCGGKRRAAKALEGFLKTHARTYDTEVFDDYRRKVHLHSEKVYRENQDILNPLGIKRSINGHHLDHKIPIVLCFREYIPIEVAGSLPNLELLTAPDNLTKCQKVYDLELLEELLKSATKKPHMLSKRQRPKAAMKDKIAMLSPKGKKRSVYLPEARELVKQGWTLQRKVLTSASAVVLEIASLLGIHIPVKRKPKS